MLKRVFSTQNLTLDDLNKLMKADLGTAGENWYLVSDYDTEDYIQEDFQEFPISKRVEVVMSIRMKLKKISGTILAVKKQLATEVKEFGDDEGPTQEEIAREFTIKKNITDSLKQALKSLQQKHIQSEEPVYSEDSANAVCNVLEAVFLHGLKGSLTNKLSSYLIGTDPGKDPQPSFWSLLLKVTHKDVVSQLNHLGQITTEIGMCRAWIRMALNDMVLESYLNALLKDKETLSKYYKRTAFLRDEEESGILKSYSQGLLNFTFQLSYNSSVLNIWTQTPLVLAGLRQAIVTPNAVVTSESMEAVHLQPDTRKQKESSPIIVRKQSSLRPQIVNMDGGSYGAASGVKTPPNTPYDHEPLSRKDIDEIRKLNMIKSGSSPGSSTATSQISHPDFGDEIKPGATPTVLSPSGSMREVQPKMRKVPSANSLRNFRSDSPNMFSPRNPAVEEKEDMSDATPEKELNPFVNEALTSCEMLEKDKEQEEVTDRTDSGVKVNETMAGIPEIKLSSATAIKKETIEESIYKEYQPETVDVEYSPVKSTNKATNKATNKSKVKKFAEGRRKSDQVTRTFAKDEKEQRDNFKRHRRKSEPLEPVLSNVTAQCESVDCAQEAMIQGDNSGETDNDNIIYEETASGSGGQTRSSDFTKGNSLVMMRGWSSDFDDQVSVPVGIEPFFDSISPEEDDMLPEINPSNIDTSMDLSGSAEQEAKNSFDALLQSYGPTPMEGARLSQVIRNLGEDEPPVQPAASQPPPRLRIKEESFEDIQDDLQEEYEVLAFDINATSSLADSEREELEEKRTQMLVSIIGEICNEKGLDQQNYQCKACSRPVGMIYGKARVCSYDGCYYCYECHENEEYYIPSKIIHNWDFRKHQVANHTYQFLKRVEEEPLLNIQKCNPRLYEHVTEMTDIRLLRVQLSYLKTYLFTCKQSIADDLRKQIWPKEYLYENIELYSLQDLLQVQSGQLAQSIRKIIKYAAKHVYDCRLCSQKGFFCEVCDDNTKVIYPFEIETTSKCSGCKAVFHKGCKTDYKPCPKCERRRLREKATGGQKATTPDYVDYACAPEQ